MGDNKIEKDSYEEIVGFLVNGKTIHYGPSALSVAKSLGIGADCRPISRKLAQLMHCCDLGINWTKLYEAPMLFYVNDEGEIDEKSFREQLENFGFIRK